MSKTTKLVSKCIRCPFIDTQRFNRWNEYGCNIDGSIDDMTPEDVDTKVDRECPLKKGSIEVFYKRD